MCLQQSNYFVVVNNEMKRVLMYIYKWKRHSFPPFRSTEFAFCIVRTVRIGVSSSTLMICKSYNNRKGRFGAYAVISLWASQSIS